MTAKRKLFFTLFLFIAPFALSLPASAKVRVYIFAGQSNMMGKGKTHKLPAAYKKQPKNVAFYYQGRQRKLAQYSHFGPEVSFAHVISRAFPKDTHIIIKHVATGSSIQQWLPGSGLFNSMLRQRGFVKVGSNSTTNKVKVDAIFWMQGEADARNSHNASRYEASLKRFISGARTQLASPNSLFVLGEINPEDPAFSMTKMVQKAQQKVQHSLSNVKLVSTQGLGKIFDHVHYDAAGQIELGKRFAKAYMH